MFEAFYTGNAQQGGHVKGTGIGLSVVMEFVQAHGGTIELVDGVHPGAHFRIRLPVRPAAAARIDLVRLQSRLAPLGKFAIADGLLVGALDGSFGLSVFPDGRAIVRGTTDLVAAQGVYDRCVGE